MALAAVALVACSRTKPRDTPAVQPSGAEAADASATPALASASPREAPNAGGIFATSSAPSAPEIEDPPTCEETRGVYLFVAPETPWTGAPLRVIAVSDKPLTAELRIVKGRSSKSRSVPDDAPALAQSNVRRGGPPYFWTAEIDAPNAGMYDAVLTQRACASGKGRVTKRMIVASWKPRPPQPGESEGLWPTRRNWNHTLENVYSAWIEHMFDAPEGEMPSWPALSEVLRDKKRNLMFDYLAAGEDSTEAPTVRPDCADLPYFLRAYFAFKLRLPFGVSECDRGGGGVAPTCKAGVIITNDDPPARPDPNTTAVKTFGTFLRGTLADKAHSGSARQPFEEESSDYYPVALSAESLRPGTIYADPYGHVLMIVKRLPQTSERGGVLLAVDGQPDGTVARKRYWRGNFLYATEPELGGPGFKRFRPVAKKQGRLARFDDETIRRHPDYGDVSREVRKLSVDAFYDAMEDVLSPRPLDPLLAMLETIAALEEQVRTRVRSVDNGRKWLEATKTAAPMPDGPEIFETTGAWEDFSTPSRDLRLLIAVDVVRSFPARVARRPERFAMPGAHSRKEVADELERILERELRSRTVTYTKSDGTPFTLSLTDVAARSSALEMAYNPNDCVEARWGAPAASAEASTCRAQAPADQRAKMESYRGWFHDRRRPPRK